MTPTHDEVVGKIQLILSQVDPSASVYTPPRGAPLLVLMAAAQAAEAASRRHETIIIARPGEVEVRNEQVTLLRMLFSQCDPGLKAVFPSLLLAELTHGNASVVIHTALTVGSVAELGAVLDKTLRGSDPILRMVIWNAIREELANESHRFSDADLDVLSRMQVREEAGLRVGENARIARAKFGEDPAAIAGLAEMVGFLGRTVERVRYLRLKRELTEGENPEINTDREALVSRMEELGFRREIAAALEQLDRRLQAAGVPLEFKECMDLARTILEEIIEDAAKKASEGSTRALPPPGKDFQPWKQLLVDVGCLTADEAELFQKLYNYLSNAGTHRLGSAPEQVRISKNMVIELGVLLLGRLERGRP